ncbi:MAG TPA: hypothetical protein VIY73_12710 [Polyangiaceae bacterium]
MTVCEGNVAQAEAMSTSAAAASTPADGGRRGGRGKKAVSHNEQLSGRGATSGYLAARIARVVARAERRLGEFTKAMPKAGPSQNARKNKVATSDSVSKSDSLASLGATKQEAHRWRSRDPGGIVVDPYDTPGEFRKPCYSLSRGADVTNATVPRPKSEKDSQVTIVLSGEWLDEAQRLAEARSEPGLAVTRADILRIAIRRGLDALQAEAKPRRR